MATEKYFLEFSQNRGCIVFIYGRITIAACNDFCGRCLPLCLCLLYKIVSQIKPYRQGKEPILKLADVFLALPL